MKRLSWIGVVGCVVVLANVAHAEILPREQLFNLRTWRTPKGSWSVSAGNLQFFVAVHETSRSASAVSWNLEVDITSQIQGFQLQLVRADTPGVRIVSRQKRPEKQSNGDSQRVTIEVTAPTMCPISERRQEVQITLFYIIGGQREIRRVALDHRCLLADFVATPSADAYARIAERYLYDPLIEHFIQDMTHVPPGTIDEEISRLKELVAFDESSIQSDPFGGSAVNEYAGVDHYVLAPIETARLGGDCEDWTILVAAYLTRRGFPVTITYNLGHVFVQADDPKDHRPVTVDFLGAQRSEVLSQARVQLPLRRVSL